MIIAIIAIAILLASLGVALLLWMKRRREAAEAARRRKNAPLQDGAGGGRRRADLRVDYADPARQRTIIDSGPDDEEPASPFMVGAAQTIGQREDQEDSYSFTDWRHVSTLNRRGFLAVLADGIGGLSNGQYASQAAVKGAVEAFENQSTKQDQAQRVLEITAAAQRSVLMGEKQDGGCTFLCVLIDDMEMSLASVGDSRIVLYRNGVLLQLNREHVLGREIDEANLLAGESRTESEQRRKAITAYLGKRELRTMDRTLRPMQLVSGDRVLLMSDGVFNALSDSAIVAYMHLEPKTAAEAIIKAVMEKSMPGQDNATIVIVGVI